MNVPKSCKTCQHRSGSGEFARCTATGFYAAVQRRHSASGGCDENFSGWDKRLSVKEKFLFWLKG